MLTKLFVHPIEGYEPRIVDLPEPILIVGMSVETNLRSIYRDVPALGRRYRNYKREHTLPNKKEPWAFAAVTWGHNERTGTMSYMMGDVVTRIETLPSYLQAFTIPAIKYAVFPIRPKNRFGWPIAIGDAKRYIYTEWMPKSAFEPAGILDDFEYHDERSARRKDPEVDLYVAIKPRVTAGG